MQIFLITMPGRHRRRESALAALLPTGLRFEIVEGVEAAKYRNDALEVDNDDWGAELTPGIVGCYMAHLNAMQRIIDYQLPWGCVLEDDFCFEEAPDFGLGEIVSYLPRRFDYIHLQRDVQMHDFERQAYDDYFDRIERTPLCTAGYLISNRLARMVVDNHVVCRRPIDHLISELSSEGDFYLPKKPLIGCVPELESEIHRSH